MSESTQSTGLPQPAGHTGAEQIAEDPRSLSSLWLSDERIANARRVWSNAYGRVISPEEAVEILTNVRRLAEVLLRGEEGNQE